MAMDMTRREMLALGVPAALLGSSALAAAQDMGGGAPAAAQRAMPAIVKLFAQAHDGEEYKLPPLPYDYEALEPHIDAQTMKLHHDIHHQGYVNGLNKAVARLADAGDLDDAGEIEALQRAISFNGGGHLLHTLFWGTMAPRPEGAGGEPEGAIAQAIEKSFGSIEGFRAYFAKAAGGVKGSGWGVLAYEPIGDRLMVFALNEHDTKLIAGAIPLLCVDVWEHAYYLKYQNKRGDYLKAWWNVVNWKAVDEMFAAHRMGHRETPAH